MSIPDFTPVITLNMQTNNIYALYPDQLDPEKHLLWSQYGWTKIISINTRPINDGENLMYLQSNKYRLFVSDSTKLVKDFNTNNSYNSNYENLFIANLPSKDEYKNILKMQEIKNTLDNIKNVIFEQYPFYICYCNLCNKKVDNVFYTCKICNDITAKLSDEDCDEDYDNLDIADNSDNNSDNQDNDIVFMTNSGYEECLDCYNSEKAGGYLDVEDIKNMPKSQKKNKHPHILCPVMVHNMEEFINQFSNEDAVYDFNISVPEYKGIEIEYPLFTALPYVYGYEQVIQNLVLIRSRCNLDWYLIECIRYDSRLIYYLETYKKYFTYEQKTFALPFYRMIEHNGMEILINPLEVSDDDYKVVLPLKYTYWYKTKPENIEKWTDVELKKEKNGDGIVKWFSISDDVLYDIKTENGYFQAGIGGLILNSPY